MLYKTNQYDNSLKIIILIMGAVKIKLPADYWCIVTKGSKLLK